MIRFLYDNQWDKGVLTVNNENPNFPVTNTQHRWWQKTYRNTSTNWVEIICEDPHNAAGSTSINCAALKYNNFTLTGTPAVIKLYNDSDIGFSPEEFTYTFPTLSNDAMIGYLPSTETNRYWMLQITDTIVSAGYHELGRVFLGSYFQPAHNFAPGGGHIDYLEIASPTVGEQGHISSIIKSSLKIFRYRFECMTPADVTIVRSMYATHRQVGGFFFTEDSANPATTTYYVRFLEQPRITPIVWSASGPYCDVEITLVESM